LNVRATVKPDNSARKLRDIAVRIREDADTFRSQADVLDRYACRLDICSGMLDEAGAKEIVDAIMAECPELFAS
jgi:hypothetical protein